jgi:hypothetical protein
MEWQQIEEKWMKMAVRLQAAQPIAQAERTPTGTAGNAFLASTTAEAGWNQPDNGPTVKSSTLA